MQFNQQIAAARTHNIPVFPHDNWELEDYQLFTVAINKEYIVQERPYRFGLTNTYRQLFDDMKNNPPPCYEDATCKIIWMDMVTENSYIVGDDDDMDVDEDPLG